MESLYTLIIVAVIGFFGIWIRHRYIEWQEDKKFWKQVDNMIERRNKIFQEAFEKLLEDMKPFIVEMVEKSRKKNAP